MDLRDRTLNIFQKLITFYGYPEWRSPLPPLDELVSTILSQNTNDRNRDFAFKALQKRFATWEDVRDANPDEVIATIRSAGLANQKAPRIQNILREITLERGELNLDFLHQMDPTEAQNWLLQFKGVGPKTAAIVVQFSLGMPAFPVDTHIHRVTGRLGLISKKVNAEQAHVLLGALFPTDTYYPAHLNLIRFGREVCKARNPKCLQCPLQDQCNYYAGLNSAQ